MYDTISKLKEKLKPDIIAILAYDRNGDHRVTDKVESGLKFAEFCFAFFLVSGTWVMKYVDENNKTHDNFSYCNKYIISVCHTSDKDCQELVLSQNGEHVSSYDLTALSDPGLLVEDLMSELGDHLQMQDQSKPVRLRHLFILKI